MVTLPTTISNDTLSTNLRLYHIHLCGPLLKISIIVRCLSCFVKVKLVMARISAQAITHSHTNICSPFFIFANFPKNIFPIYIDLPSMPPGNLIGSPSSRRNVMVGVGEPVAEHCNVTLLPSLTTMSFEV